MMAGVLELMKEPSLVLDDKLVSGLRRFERVSK